MKRRGGKVRRWRRKWRDGKKRVMKSKGRRLEKEKIRE